MPHRLLELMPGPLASTGGKIALAIMGGFVFDLLKKIGALYGELLITDPLLVALCVAFFVIDWGTGIAASLRRGEGFKSRRLRDTLDKCIQYFAVVLCGVMLANGFKESWVDAITGGADEAALLYVAMTEFVSILENVLGDRHAAIRLVRRIMPRGLDEQGRIVVEEIVRKEVAHGAIESDITPHADAEGREHKPGEIV